MEDSLSLVVSVVTAVCAAGAFGAAGAFQHRATQTAPPRKALRPGLLVDLIRVQGFRSGVLLGALGFALQVVALRFGPLTLVQPLLVTGMLFFIGFACWLEHRRPDVRLIAGALAALAGLSAFLVVAQPLAGSGRFDSSAALPLGIGLIVVVAVCLSVASRLSHEVRALPLAGATAVCYGTTAGLVRSLTSMQVGDLWTSWELYAVLIVGPCGFLLNQNAFQSGLLGAAAIATITVGDPVVSIGIGIAWLGEAIGSAPGQIVGEILALAATAIGIALLAHRSQEIAACLESAEQEPARQPSRPDTATP
ncbi:MAG: DMT family transporter [Nocardioidaceae bacterium]